MIQDTSKRSSRQKRKKRLLKCLFVLVGVFLLSATALTSFADFAIENQSSYVGATRYPLSVSYDIVSKDGTVSATLLQTQDEYIDIRTTSRHNVSSISTDKIRISIDEATSFVRNDTGDVRGSIVRYFEYTDQCSIIPTFYAPSILLADLDNNRGATAPSLLFSGFSSTGYADYSCVVYDPVTKGRLGVDLTLPVKEVASSTHGTAYEISFLPTELVAEIRRLTGYDEAPFLILEYRIDPHVIASPSSSPEYRYLYKSFHNNINVVYPSQDLWNPYTQDTTDYLSNSLYSEVTYVDTNFDFTDWLGSAFGFFNTPLFGDFTLGGLVATVLGVGLLFAFLRFFAGG